jgi:L-2-hydroxycarboxylate dehydrogenase (NAD+)
LCYAPFSLFYFFVVFYTYSDLMPLPIPGRIPGHNREIAMNRPPQEFRRLEAGRLKTFAGACLKAAGMTPEHAEQLGGLLTNSDLRGVRSHGTRALYRYCVSIREKQVNPTPDIAVLQETDTTVLVDGDGGMGYAPMMLATEKAVAKAKEKGIAMGAARHIGHYGSAGHYVHRAMEDGCTALSVQGSHPDRFGEGGRNRGQQAAYWGNPPICFGLPGRDEPPLILDAATCIMADYQRGEEFDALQSLIPAAFFKSMGYTGVGVGWGGALVGMNLPEAAKIQEKWPRARQGGLVIVMNVGAFTTPDAFFEGVDHLVRGVREQMDPVRGYDEATLPGTVEHRNAAAYGRDGIPIGLEDAERLQQAAEEFGVALPWEAD